MENLIIILILVLIIAYGVMATVKHFKGEGACCGGGSRSIRENKKLDGPKLGEIEMKIEGMHCENCEIRVERFVNKLDGAVCKANHKKKQARVSYSKNLDHDQLKKMVTDAGYEVLEILDHK